MLSCEVQAGNLPRVPVFDRATTTYSPMHPLLFSSPAAMKKRLEKRKEPLPFPSLKKIQEMRKNFDTTRWVFDSLMPIVISKNKFEASKGSIEWHNYVSESDEAFLHVVIENVYDVVMTLPNEWETSEPDECRKWLVDYCHNNEHGKELFGEDALNSGMNNNAGGVESAGAVEGQGLDDDAHQSGGKKEKRPSIAGKYTKNYRECQKYGGWRKAGLKRYNELFDLVQKDRKAHGQEFEEWYLQQHQNDNNRKNATKVTSVEDEEDDIRPRCSHDFGSSSVANVTVHEV